jgi:Delta14-sterol reductase
MTSQTDEKAPAGTPGESPPPKNAFGGPVGCLLLVPVLPLIVFYLWICLVEHDGAIFLPRTGEEWRHLIGQIPLPSAQAVLLYGAWFVMQVLFQLYLPGKTVHGTPLRDGSRLPYKMNGELSFLLSIGVVVGLAALGIFSPTVYYEQFGSLVSTVTLFTLAYSGYLYWHGRRFGKQECVHGNLVQDFFMGSSLNPRTGGFDHKLFCEARPGLILWVVGNLSVAAKQYELHGSLSTAMILVCFFHFWYIADYYLHEPAILTTWDIKHENFGYMLCFGDLVWVPFTYTFQAIYLVQHPHRLPWPAVAGIVLLNLIGFIIFRGANIQKHRFRLDPQRPVWGKPAEVIQTARGTPLLVSGFWGLARHINYLGDLMMGLAWCLPCLFGALVPYFYIIYFTILLVFRERRDQRMCREKYGADWEEYTRRVRWRILPGVY